MDNSETNRIKGINSSNNLYIQQQQVIPVQQSIPIQIQQGLPYQQNVILYSPVQVMPQQIYIQNPSLIYPQQIQNQPIIYPPQAASQQKIDVNIPIKPKELVNNQKKPIVEEKKKKSPTSKENTCPHCKKTVETELKTSCNFCTCFVYIFLLFAIPLIAIFTCDPTVCDQNCCCCCEGGGRCDCCCDYIRKCPNCGEYIYRDDSCDRNCRNCGRIC